MMKRVLSILLLLLIATLGVAQKKESDKLKKKQAVLKKKINETKSLLKATRSSEKKTLAELSLINNQIAYREELVSNINFQINQIQNEIEEKNHQIISLENNLAALKEEYAAMLRYAYKHFNPDQKLLYIFAAKSYTEAYDRIQYLQEYVVIREKQVEKIKKTQLLIGEKIKELELQVGVQDELIEAQNAEKADYLADKSAQQQALSAIQKDEQSLKEKLRNAEKEKRKVNAAIREAIRKEMEASKPKTSGGSKKGFTLTPEAKALAKNFTSNKGKLPWPVEKGQITSKYGKHPHPFVPNTTIENKGVDITTTKGAEVRAIFTGKVTSVIVIPGAGKVVMISHGNYRTVYSNLKEVFVKKGDEVDTKEAIGQLLPAESGNVSKAHLEIWKIDSTGLNTSNPELWIYK